MGYQAYISKETELYANDDGGITSDDWATVIRDDPELTVRESLEAINPAAGERISMPLKDTAIWAPDTQDEILFSLTCGRIDLPHPEGRAADKAREIAEKLGATLFGEEGEVI